jgi:hypothetical protein
MLLGEYFWLAGGLVMIAMAVSILAFDSGRARSRTPVVAPGTPEIHKARWQTGLALAMLAWGPILLGLEFW